jgi:hypothetical protein
MIVFVTDYFSNQITGGAELTSDALLENSLLPVTRINSRNITLQTIHLFKNNRWILGNYSMISDNLLLEIIKNVENYSVIEYDYKYCKYRSTHKHIETEGCCECENSSHGKLVSILMAKAKNVFWMSDKQKKEYIKVFPFLTKANNVVLSSSFSAESLSYIKSLDVSNKNNKFLILESGSWIKGTQDCVSHAQEHNLEYELISRISHKDLLKKLAESKGLIFLPKGLDTCPRIVIEAKMLGCELILNDNVQHKDEKWFQEEIPEFVEKQKKLFFDKCLDLKYTDKKKDEETKFHFIVPAYNTEQFINKTLRSIKWQDYENLKVTVVDDMSSDRTYDVAKTETDPRFSVIKPEEKNYALKNICLAINEVQPEDEDVILVVDGDDWLASTDVLNYLNKIYSEEDVLLTYGSYEENITGRRGVEPSEYPQEVIRTNTFRKDRWRASHLRTFKYKLWKEINQEDFLDEDDDFYRSAYDQAIMLPMLEMAGNKIKFIPEILHVYNKGNPLHHRGEKEKRQYETMLRIRKKSPYERKF